MKCNYSALINKTFKSDISFLTDLYYSHYAVIDSKMNRPCSMYGSTGNWEKICIWKSEERRSFERTRRGFGNNIKLDI